MPELTRKKFIEHPKYGRIYRSGDFGRLLPDGSLAFSGRRDDLVKVRGHRIELGEVNSTLLRSPDVKDCITVVCEGRSGGKQLLTSFWVPSERCHDLFLDSTQLSSLTKKLFEKLTGDLPAYMIPSFLVPVPCVPITAAGKVDKETLHEQFRQLDPNSLDAYACSTVTFDKGEPLSETESKVVEVVSDVIQCDLLDITRNTSFYRLGMDSISAIALSRRLKTAGFGQVDISEIMRNGSVARLSRLLEGRNGSEGAASQLSCPNLDSLFNNDFVEQVRQAAEKSGDKVMKVLPCTPLQEAMLSDQASDRQGAYINHLTFKVNGNMNDLKHAWHTIVERHDVLRTRFMPTDDANFSFAQIVLEKVPVPWEEIETSSVDADRAVDRQKSEFTQGANRLPFRFISCSNVDSGKKQLHLFIHHALYDGESMAQLLHEVEQIVFGIQLPPVVPYELYLEQMVNAQVEKEDHFWSRTLEQPPRDHLIVPNSGWENPDKRQFRYASGQLALPLTEIENICKKTSVTLVNVLQAAWAKLIVHYSGASDICFGGVFSCRSTAIDGAERIVGPCFNTLPMRVKVNQNATNLDLMRHLHKAKTNILPYQLTSLRRLQSRLDTNILQLFDTLLLLQSSPRPLNKSLWTLVKEDGDMDFPLVIEITPNQQTDKAELSLHFDQTRIPTDDAHIVLSAFVELVHDILNYPCARATDFGVVDGDTPSFVHVPRPKRQFPKEYNQNHTHHGDDLVVDEWLKEELEIRDVLSSLSKTNRDKIGPWTTIFQLGLDSINAIQIAHRLKETGYYITSGDLMEVGPLRVLIFDRANNNRRRRSGRFPVVFRIPYIMMKRGCRRSTSKNSARGMDRQSAIVRI